MENIIIILIIVLAVGGAAGYIYKAKKRGQTCIGCPHAKDCAKKCTCQTENKS